MFENINEKVLEFSPKGLVKQTLRNEMLSNIKQELITHLQDLGFECELCEKMVVFGIPNDSEKLPNGYLPIKLSVSIAHPDYTIYSDNE